MSNFNLKGASCRGFATCTPPPPLAPAPASATTPALSCKGFATCTPPPPTPAPTKPGKGKPPGHAKR